MASAGASHESEAGASQDCEPASQAVLRLGYEVRFVLAVRAERSFAEGAMRSSAAQVSDLEKERSTLKKQVEDLEAQSADAKTQGGALLEASCGLVPFAGIRARFALQPRPRRPSSKRRGGSLRSSRQRHRDSARRPLMRSRSSRPRRPRCRCAPLRCILQPDPRAHWPQRKCAGEQHKIS